MKKLKVSRKTAIFKQLEPRTKTTETVRGSRNVPGVYLIYKGDKLCYIGHSGYNVYKTLMRHFQSWDDPTQERVTYKPSFDFKVRIVRTTPARAKRLERALIIKHRPEDNPNKLELYTMSDLTPGERKSFNEYETTDKTPF